MIAFQILCETLEKVIGMLGGELQGRADLEYIAFDPTRADQDAAPAQGVDHMQSQVAIGRRRARSTKSAPRITPPPT